ncbi:MAG: restriction endonuclease [Gammaproteobacteria bacterium]|nr:restriction endonuclease [Gammaproteobacteria bacterium]
MIQNDTGLQRDGVPLQGGAVDRRGFLARVRNLNVWSSGGQRAPNKPLLLLLALGRLQGGEPRLASFAEIEGTLRDLLRRFGPPRKSQRPLNPFQRLCNDGLWDVPDAASVEKTTSEDFKKSDVIRKGIEGGLLDADHQLLLGNTELVAQAAELLLQGHFPESLHDDIRDAVGLRAEWVVRDAPAPARDPGFRSAVLRAYERRCAVCDYDIRLGDDLLGLEAAHIRWYAAGGPDEVNNGLALCGFHHQALDRGAWGLEPFHRGFRIVVSSEVHGQSAALRLLRDFHGERLRRPLSSRDVPLAAHVRWHCREVFRRPALTTG